MPLLQLRKGTLDRLPKAGTIPLSFAAAASSHPLSVQLNFVERSGGHPAFGNSEPLRISAARGPRIPLKSPGRQRDPPKAAVRSVRSRLPHLASSEECSEWSMTLRSRLPVGER